MHRVLSSALKLALPLSKSLVESECAHDRTHDEELEGGCEDSKVKKARTTSKSNIQDGDDMGKSNKFDYTNRKNSGATLGRIIGDAAIKEAEKLKKDAAKPVARSRKVSLSSSGGGGDGEERSTVHFIDLKVPGKELGDDGVCAMVDGLETALQAGNADASLALEDLNLHGNGLTAASLAKLAVLIDLAKNDIKTVVVSGNAIQVATDQDARDFESFLQAFHSCKSVRRLDLSGNTMLGARAFEVFTRIQTNEPAVTPVAQGGEREVRALPEERTSCDGRSLLSMSEWNNSSTDAMTAGMFLPRRCGLRSIPYIDLRQTGLNDAGALWLSYTLEEHHYPNQLTNEINAPPGNTTIAAYQQTTADVGIEWSDNSDTLGRDGLLVLRKAEDVRKHLAMDESTSMMTDSCELQMPSSWKSRGSMSLRRSSIRSVHTDDGGEHEMTELESVRKRIQRHVIEAGRIRSVELWDGALKVVVISRKVAYVTPKVRRQRTGPNLFTTSIPDPPNPQTNPSHRPPIITSSARASTTHPPTTTPTTTLSRNRGKSYAATVAALSTTAPGEPETVLTDVSNTPETPKLKFKAHRKGAISDGSDAQALVERLSAMAVGAGGFAERGIEWQREHRQGFVYRDEQTISHFPVAVFERVLSFALRAPAAQKVALLNTTQMAAAYSWGQRRETLAKECTWMRMTESAQRWSLLDGVGGLAYESAGGL